jgi:hypothetical protein
MEKIKVKFLRSHPKYSYFAGDEAELSAKQAEELLNSKHVEAHKHKAETATAHKADTATVKAETAHTKNDHHAKKSDKK